MLHLGDEPGGGDLLREGGVEVLPVAFLLELAAPTGEVGSLSRQAACGILTTASDVEGCPSRRGRNTQCAKRFQPSTRAGSPWSITSGLRRVLDPSDVRHTVGPGGRCVSWDAEGLICLAWLHLLNILESFGVIP